jgi:uncharacterized protein (DUF58 family)
MPRIWSKRVPMEFSAFAVLMAAGTALGNTFLIILSLVPLLFLAVSLALPPPGDIALTRERLSLTSMVGGKVRMDARLQVGSGVGLVTCTDSVPSIFQAEDGGNLHVTFKGRGPLEEGLSYQLTCTKRGVFRLGRARTESLHFAGLEQTRFMVDDAETQLLVEQRLIDVRRMRDPRLASRMPMPPGTIGRIGAETADFREIRKYHRGDQFRSINWKASVRLGALERGAPLVNEFDREGRRLVWIFLDAGRHMSLGTDVESAFEQAAQAGWALSQFYLSRECSVGVQTFPEGGAALPDTGRRQRAKLSRLFMEAQMSQASEGLGRVVRASRGHLQGRTPLFILITMVRRDNMEDLAQGIAEMRRLGGREAKVLVLHVNGYDLAAADQAEELSAAIMGMRDLPAFQRLRATGAQVVTWNPRRESLQSLMLLGMVKARGA